MVWSAIECGREHRVRYRVKGTEQFLSDGLRDMQRLSDITEKQTRYIVQGLHDVLPEYSCDAIVTQRVQRIIKTLKDNPSMYQFSSEELDTICMGLNDCCWLLDDILKDLEECDIPEGREYRSEIESIAALLSNV